MLDSLGQAEPRRRNTASILSGLLAFLLGAGRRLDIRLVLDVAGLGSLVVAAFTWSAGLTALGLALLILASRGDR